MCLDMRTYIPSLHAFNYVLSEVRPILCQLKVFQTLLFYNSFYLVRSQVVCDKCYRSGREEIELM